MFAKTRMKKPVEMLHANGLSISYDRVLEISAELGDAVVSKYLRDGVVYIVMYSYCLVLESYSRIA